MKTAIPLCALLVVVMLAGCKPKDSCTPAPDPAAEAANQLRSELAKVQAATEQLAQDNAELRKAVLKMADSSMSGDKDAQDKLRQAAKTITDLQAANTSLNTAVQDSDTQLKQAITDLEKIGRQAKADQADAAIKVEQMQANSRLLAKQNDRLKNKIDTLRDNLNRGSDDMDRLADELEKARAIAQSMQDQNSRLISALQQQSNVWGGYLVQVDNCRRQWNNRNSGGVREIVVFPPVPFGQGPATVNSPQPPVVIRSHNNGPGVQEILIPAPVPFGQGPAMVNQPKPPVVIQPTGHDNKKNAPLLGPVSPFYRVKSQPGGTTIGTDAVGDKDSASGKAAIEGRVPAGGKISPIKPASGRPDPVANATRTGGDLKNTGKPADDHKNISQPGDASADDDEDVATPADDSKDGKTIGTKTTGDDHKTAGKPNDAHGGADHKGTVRSNDDSSKGDRSTGRPIDSRSDNRPNNKGSAAKAGPPDRPANDSPAANAPPPNTGGNDASAKSSK